MTVSERHAPIPDEQTSPRAKKFSAFDNLYLS